MKNIFKNKDLLVAAVFIVLGVSLRLIPHAPNFAPVSAMALFAGAYLSRKIAVFVPLLMMLISDFFLGFYDIKLMTVVYLCFLGSLAMGFLMRSNKKWYNIVFYSLVSSLIFFIVTNFAVFIFSPWYEKTISGLFYCYFMAIPFLKNTLLGDLFYVSVFFGTFELSVFLAHKAKKILLYNFINK